MLKQRIDWLVTRGVKVVHFCGGEPTTHPGLAELLVHTLGRNCASRLTTNGIVSPESLLPALRAASTNVKVSLHGDRAHHDAIVGRTAFDLTTRHLSQLVAAGIATGVQTTVVAGGG